MIYFWQQSWKAMCSGSSVGCTDIWWPMWKLQPWLFLKFLFTCLVKLKIVNTNYFISYQFLNVIDACIEQHRCQSTGKRDKVESCPYTFNSYYAHPPHTRACSDRPSVHVFSLWREEKAAVRHLWGHLFLWKAKGSGIEIQHTQSVSPLITSVEGDSGGPNIR